ncbi:hypothetical protein D9615_005598 [Tricholomella constricta]|uniref:Glycosyl transferase CAP10 domain-containing protein n=1 Tax=Tricholomella constricta TaxID=117010 RepID=A0A8H5HE54_9AGAR|nr:hypothetical protein D9615_005598 [Tricholomella constricta]
MLTLFPRRSIRRPALFLAIFLFAVVCAGFLKDIAFLYPSEVDFTTMHASVMTVTRTRVIRTAWAQATRTIMAEARDAYDQDHITATVPLQMHNYRDDGLLEVNPNGPHPIFELIRNAEANWNAKLARSSKTLAEAVAEYERRYKRPAPLGFDHWWAFVEKHNVQLPDEYDQIYKDLEPYWGMDPKDLQDIQSEREAHRDTYTIGKTADGLIELLNFSLPGYNEDQVEVLVAGAFQIMGLLQDVEEFIPPFRAIFSPHDNPSLPTDFELKEDALKHAAAGTFLDMSKPPPANLNGWIAACDPASPARRTPIDWESRAAPPPTKTFIYNHRAAMDPCLHPSLLLQHGQFLSHRKGPVPHRRLIPQFSYSPTLLHHDIVTALPINWIADIVPRTNDPEWEQKIDDRLQWRGSNTGIWHARKTRWRDAQRARLVLWATQGLDGNLTVLPLAKDERMRVGEAVNVRKARYAPATLDIAFARRPGSCASETCEELQKVFEFRQAQDIKTAGKYKYILDVDGNGWSSRFKRLITSNSLIFKSTIYPEWFGDRIMPWIHYIPVQVDFSDLYDSLLFFRGDLHGENAHDELAREIAMAGRDWSLRFWRKEDLAAYMFRLFLEYARVMSADRLEMNCVQPHP